MALPTLPGAQMLLRLGLGSQAWYTAGGLTKCREALAFPILYPSPTDPGWRLPSFVAAPPAGGAPPASLPPGSRRAVRAQRLPGADARTSWHQAAGGPQPGPRGRALRPRPPPLSNRGGAGRAGARSSRPSPGGHLRPGAGVCLVWHPALGTWSASRGPRHFG